MFKKHKLTISLFLALAGALIALKAEAATECKASWYGEPFHGRTMANGRTFNMHDPSLVAHKSLPFGTKVKITNLANQKSLVATVTDRGPHIDGRCVDLSQAGAAKLGYIHRGVTRVRLEVLG